jgi:hypothetical protein
LWLPGDFCFAKTPLRSYTRDKNKHTNWWAYFYTPKATLVERPQTDVEQFLAMLRFENRSKVEELISV